MYSRTVINVVEFLRQLYCFITGLPTYILSEQSVQFSVTLISVVIFSSIGRLHREQRDAAIN